VPFSTPTIALPAGWSTAYGCAVDTSSRVLGSSEYYQFPDTNTPAACIALCGDRGFSLAGVEYGYECFCASSYVAGPPAVANVSDCNVPCAGDATQTCGGGLRLQIYTNPDALAEAAALPSGWTQTSPCSVDTPERVFADTASTTLANNTPAHCIQHCSASGEIRGLGVQIFTLLDRRCTGVCIIMTRLQGVAGGTRVIKCARKYMMHSESIMRTRR
jgi:hypothetical protein